MTTLTFDIRALNKLSERLDDEIKERSLVLLTSPADTHAEYMKAVGFYWGLRKAIDHMQEVEKEMSR